MVEIDGNVGLMIIISIWKKKISDDCIDNWHLLLDKLNNKNVADRKKNR